MHSARPTGMRAFTVVWLGQVVSLLGSGLTGFALIFWAYQLTGKATSLALMGLFHFGPTVLLSPVAGALVDRWNRKLVMMVSDLAAGASTVVLLLLYMTDSLQLWHLYAAGAFAAAFQAFQWPAYSAAISTMMPKEQYARANGMISLAESASGILTPILAGALMSLMGIAGIMAIDVVTFLLAIGALLAVRIPEPDRAEAGGQGRGSLWQDSLYGFRYIFARPSLLGLQLVFFTVNLVSNFAFSIREAMILARTGNNAAVLGSVLSAGAVGGVAGGLLMSAWGGPKRRVDGVLMGMALEGVLSVLLFGLGRGLALWGAASFFGGFFMTILNGCNQAIWQAKVPPHLQGRVFATRRLIAQITVPAAMLVAGPLADRVFEPAMMPGGGLASVFGGWIGTGPGAGMALMFVIGGVLVTVAGLGGYAFRTVRIAEEILPDHDAEAPLPAETQTS